jgi:hypothetical protein
MKKISFSLNTLFASAFRLWGAATALFSISILVLYAFFGTKGILNLIQAGPLSVLGQTLACVAITWLSWGIALFLLKNPRVRSEHGVAIVCSFFILLLYVNILRERVAYGDVGDYVRAAINLQEGSPFHSRYIYPPLLATLSQLILPLGENVLISAFWFANILSLVAFFWLLKEVLVQYGFGRSLSLWLVFIFMVVNVPILRTLGYMQINLHVTNLILLTLLLFPRHQLLSALTLAIAAHLKASPLILALPFFWVRDKKWIMSFLAGLIGLAMLTFVFYGWSPFAAFLHNARNIYSANGINFRENSVDSLIRSTAFLLNVDLSSTIIFFKIPILVLLFVTAVHNMRHATFFARKETWQDILNSVPALLVLMVIASPLVWEHHPVFLALPFLLITKKLKTPHAWIWYSFAYLLEFLMPTFDFYPWSFGRLIGPIILTILMLNVSRQPDTDMFLCIRDLLDSFSWRLNCQPDIPGDLGQGGLK